MNPIKIDYELRGANWGVYGAMKVGKSYFTKLLAYFFYKLGMPVIILDHNENEATYGILDNFWGFWGEKMPNGQQTPIKLELSQFCEADWLKMPRNLVVRVNKNKNQSGLFDFDAFFDKITYVKNTVIILDDLGDTFGNQATPIIRNFPATTINNGNQVFYQFHRLMQAHPFLRDKLQKIVLKSLPVGGNIPDDFLVPADVIKFFIDEIEVLNEPLPFQKKFAWRIIDGENQLVTLPRKIIINGEAEVPDTYVLSDYLKNKKLKR